MRRFSIVASLIVAALVALACGAAGASAALPEYLECQSVKNTGAYSDGACSTEQAKHEGKHEIGPVTHPCVKLAKGESGYTGAFDDNECTEPDPKHEGRFELLPGVVKGKPFKTAHETPIELELERSWPYRNMKCTGENNEGLVTGAKTLNLEITLTGCGGAIYSTEKCTTEGQATGTITFAPLSATLGYISAATHRVGIVLRAEGGKPLAEFDCQDGYIMRVTGSEVMEFKGEQLEAFGKDFELAFGTAEALEGEASNHLSFEVEFTTEFSMPLETSLQGTLKEKGEQLKLAA